MTQPLGLPTCPACAAIRTPGAPMCMSCWQPFEEYAPVSAAAPSNPGAQAYGTPAGAGPADSSYSSVPSRVYVPPPTVTAPNPGLSFQSTRRRGVPVVVAVAAALLLLVAGGAYLVVNVTGNDDKSIVADRFRNAKPVSFIPAFPSFPTGSDGLPETPGSAQAFSASFDPQVRTANDTMVTLQGTFDRWAKGKATDDELRSGITAFLASLKPLSFAAAASAPASLERGAAKFADAATDYTMALNALLDWLDAGSPSSKTTYSISIGNANVHWDEGLVSLYRGSGLEQPALPHPTTKR